jgi:hypothetical protein
VLAAPVAVSQKSARRLRREEARSPRDGLEPWVTLYDEFVDRAIAVYAATAIPGPPTAADLDAMPPVTAIHYGPSIPR